MLLFDHDDYSIPCRHADFYAPILDEPQRAQSIDVSLRRLHAHRINLGNWNVQILDDIAI